MIVIKLAIWVVIILGFVAWNHYVIKVKKQRPFYLLDNIAKGFFWILYGIFVWDVQMPWQADHSSFLNWYNSVIPYEFRWILVYSATSYWLLFDVIMGFLLHGDPLYVGAGSGWIDRFGTKYPVAYWTLKSVALVLLIQSIIKLSHG